MQDEKRGRAESQKQKNEQLIARAVLALSATDVSTYRGKVKTLDENEGALLSQRYANWRTNIIGDQIAVGLRDVLPIVTHLPKPILDAFTRLEQWSVDYTRGLPLPEIRAIQIIFHYMNSSKFYFGSQDREQMSEALCRFALKKLLDVFDNYINIVSENRKAIETLLHFEEDSDGEEGGGAGTTSVAFGTDHGGGHGRHSVGHGHGGGHHDHHGIGGGHGHSHNSGGRNRNSVNAGRERGSVNSGAARLMAQRKKNVYAASLQRAFLKTTENLQSVCYLAIHQALHLLHMVIDIPDLVLAATNAHALANTVASAGRDNAVTKAIVAKANEVSGGAATLDASFSENTRRTHDNVKMFEKGGRPQTSATSVLHCFDEQIAEEQTYRGVIRDDQLVIIKFLLKEDMIPKLIALCRDLPPHMVILGPLQVLHAYITRYANHPRILDISKVSGIAKVKRAPGTKVKKKDDDTSSASRSDSRSGTGRASNKGVSVLGGSSSRLSVRKTQTLKDGTSSQGSSLKDRKRNLMSQLWQQHAASSEGAEQSKTPFGDGKKSMVAGGMLGARGDMLGGGPSAAPHGSPGGLNMFAGGPPAPSGVGKIRSGAMMDRRSAAHPQVDMKVRAHHGTLMGAHHGGPVGVHGTHGGVNGIHGQHGGVHHGGSHGQHGLGTDGVVATGDRVGEGRERDPVESVLRHSISKAAGIVAPPTHKPPKAASPAGPPVQGLEESRNFGSFSRQDGPTGDGIGASMNLGAADRKAMRESVFGGDPHMGSGSQNVTEDLKISKGGTRGTLQKSGKKSVKPPSMVKPTLGVSGRGGKLNMSTGGKAGKKYESRRQRKDVTIQEVVEADSFDMESPEEFVFEPYLDVFNMFKEGDVEDNSGFTNTSTHKPIETPTTEAEGGTTMSNTPSTQSIVDLIEPRMPPGMGAQSIRMTPGQFAHPGGNRGIAVGTTVGGQQQPGTMSMFRPSNPGAGMSGGMSRSVSVGRGEQSYSGMKTPSARGTAMSMGANATMRSRPAGSNQKGGLLVHPSGVQPETPRGMVSEIRSPAQMLTRMDSSFDPFMRPYKADPFPSMPNLNSTTPPKTPSKHALGPTMNKDTAAKSLMQMGGGGRSGAKREVIKALRKLKNFGARLKSNKAFKEEIELVQKHFRSSVYLNDTQRHPIKDLLRPVRRKIDDLLDASTSIPGAPGATPGATSQSAGAPGAPRTAPNNPTGVVLGGGTGGNNNAATNPDGTPVENSFQKSDKQKLSFTDVFVENVDNWLYATYKTFENCLILGKGLDLCSDMFNEALKYNKFQYKRSNELHIPRSELKPVDLEPIALKWFSLFHVAQYKTSIIEERVPATMDDSIFFDLTCIPVGDIVSAALLATHGGASYDAVVGGVNLPGSSRTATTPKARGAGAAVEVGTTTGRDSGTITSRDGGQRDSVQREGGRDGKDQGQQREGREGRDREAGRDGKDDDNPVRTKKQKELKDVKAEKVQKALDDKKKDQLIKADIGYIKGTNKNFRGLEHALRDRIPDIQGLTGQGQQLSGQDGSALLTNTNIEVIQGAFATQRSATGAIGALQNATKGHIDHKNGNDDHRHGSDKHENGNDEHGNHGNRSVSRENTIAKGGRSRAGSKNIAAGNDTRDKDMGDGILNVNFIQQSGSPSKSWDPDRALYTPSGIHTPDNIVASRNQNSKDRQQSMAHKVVCMGSKELKAANKQRDVAVTSVAMDGRGSVVSSITIMRFGSSKDLLEEGTGSKPRSRGSKANTRASSKENKQNFEDIMTHSQHGKSLLKKLNDLEGSERGGEEPDGERPSRPASRSKNIATSRQKPDQMRFDFGSGSGSSSSGEDSRESGDDPKKEVDEDPIIANSGLVTANVVTIQPKAELEKKKKKKKKKKGRRRKARRYEGESASTPSLNSDGPKDGRRSGRNTHPDFAQEVDFQSRTSKARGTQQLEQESVANGNVAAGNLREKDWENEPIVLGVSGRGGRPRSASPQDNTSKFAEEVKRQAKRVQLQQDEDRQFGNKISPVGGQKLKMKINPATRASTMLGVGNLAPGIAPLATAGMIPHSFLAHGAVEQRHGGGQANVRKPHMIEDMDTVMGDKIVGAASGIQPVNTLDRGHGSLPKIQKEFAHALQIKGLLEIQARARHIQRLMIAESYLLPVTSKEYDSFKWDAPSNIGETPPYLPVKGGLNPILPDTDSFARRYVNIGEFPVLWTRCLGQILTLVDYFAEVSGNQQIPPMLMRNAVALQILLPHLPTQNFLPKAARSHLYAFTDPPSLGLYHMRLKELRRLCTYNVLDVTPDEILGQKLIR